MKTAAAWARPEAACGVVDPAKAVGVEKISRARRHVGDRDRRLAVAADPFGKRRNVQGAAGGAVQPVAEIGLADREADEPFALVERHRIAEEAMARRQAPGGDRGGTRPRRRREDAPMIGEPRRALPEL